MDIKISAIGSVVSLLLSLVLLVVMIMMASGGGIGTTLDADTHLIIIMSHYSTLTSPTTIYSDKYPYTFQPFLSEVFYSLYPLVDPEAVVVEAENASAGNNTMMVECGLPAINLVLSLVSRQY